MSEFTRHCGDCDYTAVYRQQRRWLRIGATIRAARQAMGWSQRDLARAIGAAEVSVREIESRGRACSPRRLTALALALGIELDALTEERQ